MKKFFKLSGDQIIAPKVIPVLEAYLLPRVVLSNMPEIGRSEDTDDSSCDLVRFGTSPVMSTYLVAIVVGEFDYIEDKSEEGITCRVYSPLGKKEQGRSERQWLDIALN